MSIAKHVPLEQPQRFYDHVSQTPGSPAKGIQLIQMHGSAGAAKEGWPRVFHRRVPGSAARLDYVYRDDYVGERGDAHAIVRVKAISVSSH